MILRAAVETKLGTHLFDGTKVPYRWFGDRRRQNIMESGNSRVASCGAICILCSAMTVSLGQSVLLAQQPSPAQSQTTTATPAAGATQKIPNDQLDSLVAPIALYPDPLLSQTLVASTYPLEIIQLEQWLKRNPNLKDKALLDAVEKQTWDPSIQAMASFPDVLNRLAQNVAWTTDLGNAFLAQQSDVMSAVQRMRAKAQAKGTLKTSAEQVVKMEAVEGREVILVEQANPEVVFIPSYDPMVVYGPLTYPYYSYYYPGYVSGMGLAFGTGLVLGAAWGGGWGYGCGWGHGDVNVNVNNKYVNHYNKQNNINNANKNWQHNPQHRGGAPYGDRNTANKYGGRARPQTAGVTAANRAGAGMRMGAGGGIGTGAGTRPGGGGLGVGNIGAGNIGGNRSGGGLGGAGARPGGGNVSTMPATRPSGSGGATRFGGERAGGGGDRIGGRQTSFVETGGGAFGGGGGGFSGNSVRASSSRGSYSMGGGGFSRGGGGMRGGGGGRRR